MLLYLKIGLYPVVVSMYTHVYPRARVCVWGSVGRLDYPLSGSIFLCVDRSEDLIVLHPTQFCVFIDLKKNKKKNSNSEQDNGCDVTSPY